MPLRLEVALSPRLPDAEGEGIRKKARDHFGIPLASVRAVHILTLDAALSEAEAEAARTRIFTNPVTQVSSFSPLPIPFDWVVWIGFRPGVRDNPGATAVEAMTDVLGRALAPGEAVYTSTRYCLSGGNITRAQAETLAGRLLANDIIQQWKVFGKDDWDPAIGVGIVVPKVRLDHRPRVAVIPAASDEDLLAVSRERNLALHPADVPTIRQYFSDPDVRAERAEMGLSDPTDVELEYISQGRSDHCNHNTFTGRFIYSDLSTGEAFIIENLFSECIKKPTLAIQKQKPWVVSVLWDNAGAARFDDDHLYVITGETHNSPSNMEAYGGAITGIVGVYRDPMGTGKGAKLIAGTFGFCVGPRDYAGPLAPRLHPRRLLDGIIEGVRDGGNKSGIPTPHGTLVFHPGYLGKCLVYVTAVGIMPARVDGRPSEEKEARPGDLIIMCGGRVGKDGIHGVTASSEVFSEHTPAGHVQIGDPYTQKKMHDFLLEARDEGLITFITDNGGGGLSSSVGESARSSGGCRVELSRVPLKYEGLDPWEIWVSESQERMTVAVAPEHEARFFALADKHEVESTVIGEFTDSGKLHLTFEGKTCAFVDLDLLTRGFPQWEFACEWRPPADRGLFEPVVSPPAAGGCNALLLDILARPNVCSREWINRQYDHEVQGTSVIKPFVGVLRDIPSDAAVLRPVLTSGRGLALAQAISPAHAALDAGAMTALVMDEAVRRVVACGADPDTVGGVDNFCWPTIQYDPTDNPDGKHKAAQLVRSCLALKDLCLAWGIPLLSGKDSMYVDGHLPGPYGERRKVSGPESLQFTTTAIVDDVFSCQTPDPKFAGDLVYLLGETKNELGGSEYYEHLGYIGANAPAVEPEAFLARYRALHKAISSGLCAGVHGVYRGGLGVHLALSAMAGGLGLRVDLSGAPARGADRDDTLLFSESAGRFLVFVAPENREKFETLFAGTPFAVIGEATVEPVLSVTGFSGAVLVQQPLADLRAAWKSTFGGLA